jgi:hypothetical protein
MRAARSNAFIAEFARARSDPIRRRQLEINQLALDGHHGQRGNNLTDTVAQATALEGWSQIARR